MNFPRFLTGLILISTLFFACSKAPVLTNQGDSAKSDLLFERGMKFFDAGKFDKAATVFNEFVYSYPYHEDIAKGTFMLAESYFKDGQFELASMEYRRISQRFEDSEYAERAELMIGESYLSASPRTDLEQDKTKTALEYFKDFLTFRPGSEFVPMAEDGIRRCREKLAKKEFDIALSYFKLTQFDAAILYCDLIEEEYGGTIYVPRARLLKARSLIGLEKIEDARPILNELADSSATDETSKEATKLLKKIDQR